MLVAILSLCVFNTFLLMLLGVLAVAGGKHLEALIRRPIGIPMYVRSEQDLDEEELM